MPADWTVTEALTTPPLGVVRYDNGVSLTVDQLRFALAENAVASFGEEHRVHDIGRAYLLKLPHVPYRSLGLNCRVSARQVDPRRWLLERFAASWTRDEPSILGIRPKLTLSADDAVCHLDLFDAREADGEAVVVDCNVHHPGPLGRGDDVRSNRAMAGAGVFHPLVAVDVPGSTAGMSWSDATDNPAFEEVRRAAVLEALSRDDFTPHWPQDDSSAHFSDGLPMGTALREHGHAPSVTKFSAGWNTENPDSSAADPSSQIIGRIAAAANHDDIIAALVLLELDAIANRLGYLYHLGEDDPDEPSMALASLRRLALFFVSEPELAHPEIGLSPDGLLQAQWRVEDGGVLAMKFLPVDLIRFAAVSCVPSYGQRRRVEGTLMKDDVLAAVRGFLSRGAP